MKWKSNTIFSRNICPYLFSNVNIDLFNLEGIALSLIENNVFSFYNLSVPNLYSSIFHFQLILYHIDLSERILHKEIFKTLAVLDLNGVIDSIESDLFKSFVKLQFIRLRTQNVKKLFVTNNKWLQSLNRNVIVNLARFFYCQSLFSKS